MLDTDPVLRSAYSFQSLRDPILRQAIAALQLPPASKGLDAGCGIGLQTTMLAETVGAGSHVTGLDLSAELLTVARDIIQDAGLAGRVSFREGDVNQLPFDDDTFDWAWSLDCIGYAPMDPLRPLRELSRAVKPGGTIAILAWSDEQLLPGHPLLEAKLKGTTAGIAPFVTGQPPQSHFLRALGWFHQLGMTGTQAQTFAGEAHAPLSADQRHALESLITMRWPGVETELTAADWTEFQRLCLPDSADFILDKPDYYAFFTYTMFWGRVGKLSRDLANREALTEETMYATAYHHE